MANALLAFKSHKLSQLQPLHTEQDVPQVPGSSTLQSIHSTLGLFWVYENTTSRCVHIL